MKNKTNLTRLVILLVIALLLIVYLSIPSVNAFITNAAAVLGVAVTNQNGEDVANFPAGNEEDLQKLRDAGYVLMMEEVG